VLGQLYEHGDGGLTKDDVKAVALYRLAADQNLVQAQFRLGIMYSLGYGVPKNEAENEAEAWKWFQLAAAQGHHLALCHVAFSHEFGIDIPENKAEAIRWYRLAQAAGIKVAANALRRLGAE
jgi:TPR repeat protein